MCQSPNALHSGWGQALQHGGPTRYPVSSLPHVKLFFELSAFARELQRPAVPPVLYMRRTDNQCADHRYGTPWHGSSARQPYPAPGGNKEDTI